MLLYARLRKAPSRRARSELEAHRWGHRPGASGKSSGVCSRAIEHVFASVLGTENRSYGIYLKASQVVLTVTVDFLLKHDA